MIKLVMVKMIYLKVDLEKVWCYIIKKDKLVQWFYEIDCDLDEKVFFQYYSFYDDKEDCKLMWGDIFEVDLLNKLVYIFMY